MNSRDIRQKFLKFFEGYGHKIVPSSSLIPENDPTVLFTTAGMQQFKPYYLGEKSPFGDKVVSVQKCVRTSDIDEVGDNTHLTFFEMLGNFAFNNAVSKKEAIQYAYDFITKELGLVIDYVSVFSAEGGSISGRKDKILDDIESENIWRAIDSKIKIVKSGKEDNFWGPTGEEGPCGPTTEIYVNGVEIWNIVFNEYYKNKDGTYRPLEIKGIDTGMGLERLLVAVQGKNNVYETDLFHEEKTREERIISDHVKASLFLISDGVAPSNTGSGYILRRLIRRAVRLSKESLESAIEKVKKTYEGAYILDDKGEIKKEEEKFRHTLEKGLKEFEKGEDPFILFTTYGFPIELTLELAHEQGKTVDMSDFKNKMKSHQIESRKGAEHKFKGGLADTDPKTIRLHTAHHLLLAALQKVLGKGVKQRGSNITQERLRLDFAFERKLTDEEKKQIEDLVNQKIKEGLDVIKKEMPKAEAEKLGAEMEFGAKYGDTVSVYMIGGPEKSDFKGSPKSDFFSIEFCGGPHVKNTAELAISNNPSTPLGAKFKILKEEAIATGIRRIKAILE